MVKKCKCCGAIINKSNLKINGNWFFNMPSSCQSCVKSLEVSLKMNEDKKYILTLISLILVFSGCIFLLITNNFLGIVIAFCGYILLQTTSPGK